MKFLSSFILLIVGSTGSLWAQSVQYGVVQEYNGTQQKRPIPQVEIAVRNAARVLSAKDGRFELNFRTLKRGDKVEVREVVKLGYEVFNKDAIDAWRVASDGEAFPIVLCRSDRFKALKDKYSALASKSYASQQAKAEKALTEQLRKGDLQQEEYERRLSVLQDQYEQQLEDLDTYIDRFARIDLGTLSAEEKSIIDLVQAGRIDEAVQAYDKMGILSQMEQLSQQGAKVQSALSALEQKQWEIEAQELRLYDMVCNQINLLGMAGGKENFDRIAQLYESTAQQLSRQPKVVSRCATFFLMQRNFEKSIHWFEVYLLIEGLSPSQRVSGEKHLGDALFKLGRQEEGLRHNQRALDILTHMEGTLSTDDWVNYVGALSNRCLMAESQRTPEQNVAEYLQAIAVCDSIQAQGIEHADIDCVRFISQNNLSILYINLGQLDKALSLCQQTADYARSRVKESDDLSRRDFAYSLSQLGLVLWYTNQIDQSQSALKEALEAWRLLYEHNPLGHRMYYANVANNLALTYFTQEKFDNSLEYMQLSLSLYAEQCADGSDESKNLYASQHNDVGFTYFSSGKWDEALSHFQQAQQIQQQLCKEHYETYIAELNRTNINIMQIYLCQQRYDDCEAMDAETLRIAESIYNQRKEGYLLTYLYACCNHGELLLARGRTQEALSVWRMITTKMPDFAEKCPAATFPKVMTHNYGKQ